MKNSILKSLAIALIAVLFNLNSNAQQLKDLAVGPNGGNMFPTNVKSQKVELKMDNNKATFYIVNEKNQNAKLTAAAATADVIIDYNGEQPAETRQVTITSKNKFEVTLPQSSHPINFVAFHANFNGDIMEARFIIRDLSAPAPAPVK
ncbi:MAG: hypothetical protein ABI723_03970 [Bacteroidia bacterium]